MSLAEISDLCKSMHKHHVHGRRRDYIDQFAPRSSSQNKSQALIVSSLKSVIMPVVAIAGGTASVGRFIVEETIVDGKFEVIVLSRKV